MVFCYTSPEGLRHLDGSAKLRSRAEGLIEGPLTRVCGGRTEPLGLRGGSRLASKAPEDEDAGGQ